MTNRKWQLGQTVGMTSSPVCKKTNSGKWKPFCDPSHFSFLVKMVLQQSSEATDRFRSVQTDGQTGMPRNLGPHILKSNFSGSFGRFSVHHRPSLRPQKSIAKQREVKEKVSKSEESPSSTFTLNKSPTFVNPALPDRNFPEETCDGPSLTCS